MSIATDSVKKPENNLGINIAVRLKNPWFLIGVIGVVLTSIDITADTCTTWASLFELLISAIQNPFKVGSAVVALIGVIVDPTTMGIGDSAKALTYKTPKR